MIETDPFITTNGKTDFGTIYRGAELDGPASLWFFGSTSDYDKLIGFDSDVFTGDRIPLAAFKFSALSLLGNPVIDIGEGGPNDLALISVGDLTSGPPGRILTFAGIDFLLLATQNGSITLTSDLTFQNIPMLALYARGADSVLTFDAGLSGISNLNLISEGVLAATGSLTIDQTNAIDRPSGVILSLLEAGSISIGQDLTLSISNSDLASATLLNILSSGDMTVNGAGGFSLTINNAEAEITGNALLSTTAGGDLTAGAVHFLLNNQAGAIDGNATFSLNSGGSLSTTDGLATGSTLALELLNDGGSILGNATLNAALTGVVTTAGDASFRISNESGSIGADAAITVKAGPFSANTLLVEIDNLGGTVRRDSSIVFNAGGDVATSGDATFQILQESEARSNASVTLNVGSFTLGGSLIVKIGDATSSFDLENVAVNVTNDISLGGQLAVGGNVAAGGSVFASAISSDELNAGSAITIDNSAGNFDFGLAANTITAGGALNLINAPTISPNGSTSDGSIGFTPVDFSLTATAIVSSGATHPLLSANGSAADASFGNDNPGNGGNITLNLTGGGLTIGSTGDLTGIEANGGRAAIDSTAGGNGGTVNITATGDVTLDDGNISATSALLPSGGAETLGNGGTVNVTTSGAVTVNSKIEVSSAVQPNPVRGSKTGGNISLTSTKRTAGAAITVSNSGQLLALLDQAAPGPGGKITILASGGRSSVNVHGTAIADRGTVDIRHTGANGTVNLGDASGNNVVLMRGDIVKAGALGNNGVLTIGQGTMSANDTLKLYAASANGEVRFIDNVSIGGTNLTIIAGNTVTINDGKTVNVTGARADVYTGFNGDIPNANYSGSGGNGSTSGVFGGAGANSPQPIGNAPPFDAPPGG